MQFTVGDKVRITRREGEGNTGTVTKVSEIDHVFPYTVQGDDGTIYVKEEKSLEAYAGDPVVKKKRGRKPGTVVKKKKQPSQPKAADRPHVNISFTDKYNKFISTLTLEEFIKLRDIINLSYNDVSNAFTQILGLKQNDE